MKSRERFILNAALLLLAGGVAGGCEQKDNSAATDRETGAGHASAELQTAQSQPQPGANQPGTGAGHLSAQRQTASPVTYELRVAGLPETGMWKCDPVFGDVNEDGHLDMMILPRLGKGPQAWLGDGKGNWTESSEGLWPHDRSCGGGLALADIDRDGHLDLAVADHCNGVYVYLGDGAGSWTMVAQQIYPVEFATEEHRKGLYIGAEDLDVGDVNGDGHLDIVAAGADEGGINVSLGDGTGENWTRDQRSNLPINGWALRVLLHDFNRDGRLDLLASYSDGPRLWINSGRGGEAGDEQWTWSSGGLPTPRMQGIYHGMAIADFNHDGLDDFAVANAEGFVSVILCRFHRYLALVFRSCQSSPLRVTA